MKIAAAIPPTNRAGFSLLEMVVATFIALIIIGSIGSTTQAQMKHLQEIYQQLNILRETRLLHQALARDLALASSLEKLEPQLLQLRCASLPAASGTQAASSSELVTYFIRDHMLWRTDERAFAPLAVARGVEQITSECLADGDLRLTFLIKSAAAEGRPMLTFHYVQPPQSIASPPPGPEKISHPGRDRGKRPSGPPDRFKDRRQKIDQPPVRRHGQ